MALPDRRVQARVRMDQGHRLQLLIPRESVRDSSSLVAAPLSSVSSDRSSTTRRVRGLDRVRLHADLTMLAKVACAVVGTRTPALAAQPAMACRFSHHSPSASASRSSR